MLAAWGASNYEAIIVLFTIIHRRLPLINHHVVTVSLLVSLDTSMSVGPEVRRNGHPMWDVGRTHG